MATKRTLTMSDDTWNTLTRLAAEATIAEGKEVSRSEIVRRAVEEYAKKKGKSK